MAVITGTAGAVSGRVARRLDRLSEKQFALLVSIPGLLLLFLIVLPPTLAVFGLSTFRIELAQGRHHPQRRAEQLPGPAAGRQGDPRRRSRGRSASPR